MHIDIKKSIHSLIKTFPVMYLGILLVTFLITMVFIYRNIYLTIAQVETVAELERTVARERVNRTLWNKVISSRVDKFSSEESPAATSTPPLVRDPFQPL